MVPWVFRDLNQALCATRCIHKCVVYHTKTWLELEQFESPSGSFAQDPSVSKMKGGSKICWQWRLHIYLFIQQILSTIWPRAGYQNISVSTAYFIKDFRREIFLWHIQPEPHGWDNRVFAVLQHCCPLLPESWQWHGQALLTTYPTLSFLQLCVYQYVVYLFSSPNYKLCSGGCLYIFSAHLMCSHHWREFGAVMHLLKKNWHLIHICTYVCGS